MKDMLHLRIVAVASNVAFLAYGVALGLIPVWLLHLVLLPVNVIRLWQVGSRITVETVEPRDIAPAFRLTRPRSRSAIMRRNPQVQALTSTIHD